MIYLRIMNYFRAVAREVKRYDSITRSPIYAHFSESLGGLSTIRAYGLGPYFSAENERRVGSNVSAWYSLKACDRWLSIRLENLGNLIVLAAALLAVGTNTNRGEGTAAGLAGFSLSFAMAVTGLANWLVRTFSEAEQQMNSVERVGHYIDTVEVEPYDAPPALPATTADGKPAPPVVHVSNPDFGKDAPEHYARAYGSSGMLVQFKGFGMRYRPDTPQVLNDVCFTVTPGEQVGVVGRTGSGKSSLMVSLFRLCPDGCTEGTIELDGVASNALGLRDLRRALAIIPQDSAMFSGTVRSNLDPVGQVASAAKKAHPHDTAAAAKQADEVLWSVLERVGLKDVITARAGGLDAPVAELGEGFSQGQRQLLALGRILIRPSRLVLLDEASSSLDFASDAQLQKALREAFPASAATMLIIAHRINTIIACDKVCVVTRRAEGGARGCCCHPFFAWLRRFSRSTFRILVQLFHQCRCSSWTRAASRSSRTPTRC